MGLMKEEFSKRIDIYKYEMYEALKEISKGEGRFSIDHLKHAENTIEDMQSIAKKMIKKIEYTEGDVQ